MNRKCRGFTLIEVLLAVFITAIITAVLTMMFNTSLRSYRQGRDIMDITRKGEFILGQISREMRGAVVQSGRISFKGEETQVYFMAPADSSSSVDLCEIGYRLDGDTIKRSFVTAASGSYYQYPDPVSYGESENEFCSGIETFSIRYYAGGSWQESWDSSTLLPDMAELTVTVRGKYGSPVQRKTFTGVVYIR